MELTLRTQASCVEEQGTGQPATRAATVIPQATSANRPSNRGQGFPYARKACCGKCTGHPCTALTGRPGTPRTARACRPCSLCSAAGGCGIAVWAPRRHWPPLLGPCVPLQTQRQQWQEQRRGCSGGDAAAGAAAATAAAMAGAEAAIVVAVAAGTSTMHEQSHTMHRRKAHTNIYTHMHARLMSMAGTHMQAPHQDTCRALCCTALLDSDRQADGLHVCTCAYMTRPLPTSAPALAQDFMDAAPHCVSRGACGVRVFGPHTYARVCTPSCPFLAAPACCRL